MQFPTRSYRLCFKDQTGEVFAVHHFDCRSDAEAIELANEMRIPTISLGFDLWNEQRLVCRYPEPEA